MNEEIQESIQVFVSEAGELLDEMESALLVLEEDPSHEGHINTVFRAVHTIKGSAGLFSYDHIVDFSHHVESVLDRVRDGQQKITSELLSILLACHDILENLVQAAVNDQGAGDEEVQERTRGIAGQLEQYLGESACAVDENPMVSHEVLQIDDQISGIELGSNWHISLRFGPDVLRNGMDPLSFMRYLSRLGEVVQILPVWDDMPGRGEMEPESCYLDLEIEFKSDADKVTIENVFQFVKDDCKVTILPPLTRHSLYKEAIEDLPGEPMRLGDILVESGAVTERELKEALEVQQSEVDQAELKMENISKTPIGEVLIHKGSVHPELVNAAVNKQAKNKGSPEKTIRVSADKLESLINLMGELVISTANIALLANLTRKDTLNDALIEATENMGQLVDGVRDASLGLRMVQIGETFFRFRRIVRDVSHKSCKDIELKISGGEAELDKTVIEKISDPLLHLVRNAIDHGIESTETRHKTGKPKKGLLHLSASHDSGGIVIKVSDDGCGLSHEKILAKAQDLGLVKDNQKLSDQEVYRLIFEPGFSTAEQVTDLSGRGVGMDVVRRNIEALRGHVDVESQPGKGTSFSIHLPLTLAIIDGFLVRVGKSFYVIPLDMVEECTELPEEFQNASQLNSYMDLRGEVLPFIHLAELFQEKNVRSGRENIVVAKFAGQKAGLVVDELHGEYQTVIKPLGKVFRQLHGISGATILGSGKVAMVIDVPALVKTAASGAFEHGRFSSNSEVLN